MQVSNVQCVVDNGTILVSMDHEKGEYRTKFGRRNNLLLAWEGNRKIESNWLGLHVVLHFLRLGKLFSSCCNGSWLEQILLQ
jgi:hypothetical protein